MLNYRSFSLNYAIEHNNWMLVITGRRITTGSSETGTACYKKCRIEFNSEFYVEHCALIAVTLLTNLQYRRIYTRKEIVMDTQRY